MNLPNYYIHIKNIFDLTLFGKKSIDRMFDNSKEICFSEKYVNYYQSRDTKNTKGENTILKDICLEYLGKLNYDQKIEISWIIYDYPKILAFFYTENESDSIRFKNHTFAGLFELDFDTYTKTDLAPPSIWQFFQFFLSHFRYVDINKYENYKINRDAYFSLLIDHLQSQNRISKAL